MAKVNRGPVQRRAAVVLKLVIIGGLVGAGGVTALAVTGSKGPQGSARPVTADMATVAKLSFDITTTATGELQARNQIELRSQLESESSIVEIAPEGTQVQKGDLLIRINSDQIQTQIDDVSIRVTSAKADLVAADKAVEITESENASKIRQAQLKLELAELALKQWQEGELEQMKQDIRLDLDRTSKDLKRLEEYYEQSVKLHAAGFLSKNDLQKDEIALREARAADLKAKLAEQTYFRYEMPKEEKTKTSDVTEAKAELERVQEQAKIQLTIKQADKLSKSELLANHERKLERLQRQLAACTIIAPQDGLVVYATSAGRNGSDEPFTVGRKVRPQETLIVLPDTSEMVAAVRVHESLTGRMRVGQPASVKVDAVGGRVFSGRVDSIGVMAETQDRWRSDPNRREYIVRIALGHDDGETVFKPSMRCEATVTLGRVEDVPTLPIQAIFTDEAVRFVYVPKGSKFVRVPVKTGRRSDLFAEISAGLEAGQRVLLREPLPGEVLQEPWDAGQLKLAGFQLDPDGKPSPIGGMAGGREGMGRGEGRPGGDEMREGGGPGGGPVGGGERRGRGERGMGSRGGRGGQPGATGAPQGGPSGPSGTSEHAAAPKPETPEAKPEAAAPENKAETGR